MPEWRSLANCSQLSAQSIDTAFESTSRDKNRRCRIKNSATAETNQACCCGQSCEAAFICNDMQSVVACRSQSISATAPQARRRCSTLAAAVQKGFGAPKKQVTEEAPSAADEEQAAASNSSAAEASAGDKEEALEALLRRRKSKKGKVEPKVKVESAAVDMATGRAPSNPAGEAEGRVLQVLLGFFGILLTEGLVLAGSGFLPAELDSFVQDVVYPSYSPQMLLFLGMSSAYGLFKTGKLPGQKQIK